MDAETTIERIQSRDGVVGFVICGSEKVDEKGEMHYEIHRKGQGMTKDSAQTYADRFSQLTNLARGVVRDLDPQNELLYFRIRAKKQEIMCAPKYDDSGDAKYHIVALQNTSQPQSQ